MVLYRTPCSQHTRVLWHGVQHEAVTRRSPWPAAFPPCPPPAVSRSCSGTSRVLCSCSTPRTCIPDLSALGFLQTARVLSRGRDRGLPVLAHEVSLRARGLRLRRVRVMLALSHHPVLPSPCVQKVGTLNWVFEALYLARKCLCLRLACRLTTARPRLEVRMVRYSFPVRLFHSLLHAGLSRRIGRLPISPFHSRSDRGASAK
jgi:hypothetical protein